MDRSLRPIVVCAGLSGFVAIAASAFGAHSAPNPEAKAWLETGGHYQLVHAAAALAAALLSLQGLSKAKLAAWLFLIGAGIFSATLYLMALGGPHIPGAITPIGGVIMMVGWAILVVCPLLSRPA